MILQGSGNLLVRSISNLEVPGVQATIAKFWGVSLEIYTLYLSDLGQVFLANFAKKKLKPGETAVRKTNSLASRRFKSQKRCLLRVYMRACFYAWGRSGRQP